MKIIAKREAILSPLQAVIGVVERKQTMPILANVLVAAKGLLDQQPEPSREQIIEAVWGYTADHESERSVNVHVRRLREKIEADPSRPALLLTVPGVGYRLVGEK